MGLFSAFQSTSSVAGDFKKKFTEACQFFIDVSYEPSKYSWATIHAKKIAYMTELSEFCKYRVSNPRNEAFTIYTNGADPMVRLNMTTALVIAQRYLEDMENGIRLSKSRTDYIIQDVINNGSMYDYDCVLAKYT
jgi:hypothetical protein